ncbi:hypothetical protein [Bosea sp. PAMC 26642]|uniref:hypothetical protein n=1 Tax=Bosea sp. (strain PAMC 26642) TaxID=1792307 RepID=UPI0012E75D0B|nr:hypothetical protein [Bosea sp. PAMC 26642]
MNHIAVGADGQAVMADRVVFSPDAKQGECAVNSTATDDLHAPWKDEGFRAGSLNRILI